MNQPTKQSSRHVHAVLAALDILDCLEKESPLSLNQLIKITGFTRNRVMRLTGTLEARRYLMYDPQSEKLLPGPQLMVLGKVFERNISLIYLARPLLRDLAKKTGESATLYIRDQHDQIVLAREEGSQGIRYSVVEGQRIPVHVGASGRVILAFGPDSIAQQILKKRELPRLTDRTITDPRSLADHLEQTKIQGYAFSESEGFPDASAIAMPVFNHEDQLVATLTLAGPTTRFTSEKISWYRKELQKATNKLCGCLGWKGRSKFNDRHEHEKRIP